MAKTSENTTKVTEKKETRKTQSKILRITNFFGDFLVAKINKGNYY